MPDFGDDFFGIWRSLLQQWETQANTVLTETVNSEAFTREFNRAAAANLRLQEAFNRAVEKSLAALNLPSRGDVARLADQLSVVERRLDLLLAQQNLRDGGAPPPRPPRTRRPPAAKDPP